MHICRRFRIIVVRALYSMILALSFFNIILASVYLKKGLFHVGCMHGYLNLSGFDFSTLWSHSGVLGGII